MWIGKCLQKPYTQVKAQHFLTELGQIRLVASTLGAKWCYTEDLFFTHNF